MTTKKINDLLTQIIYEAKAYNTFEDIEKLVQSGTDLSMIPLQPLYTSLLTTPSSQVAAILPNLSREQRQSLLDLDLWNKDVVDVDSFEYWIEAYSMCQDQEITQEFIGSEEFYLYLKSRINIHTFDVEDPMYPDHDDYFLTDDMLLLIEFGDEYKYANELRYLIRLLYDQHGVEGAYTSLFKLVNDSFSFLQETTYHSKKDRLREYGFVDYYEAVEKLFPFISFSQIKKLILNTKSITGDIDPLSQNQSLHSSALVSFNVETENISQELGKVKSEKRQNFLNFTFIRLINSTITVKDALKSGRVELTRIGKYTKLCLDLGLQHVKSIEIENGIESESIFDRFDFFDVYKIGHSMISIQQKTLKKSLSKTPFDEHDFEYFVGAWWSSFLENSFHEIPKMKSFGAGLQQKVVADVNTYDFWKKETKLFVELLPFIHRFFTMFDKLKTEGKLNNEYYLNYDIDNIDFEAIVISSFINFCLGNFADSDVNRMGLSIQELKEFFKGYFIEKDQEYLLIPVEDPKMHKDMMGFLKSFGFEAIEGFERYLYGILSEHLNGYEFDTLSDEDFKHVGGPILLQINKVN